MSEDVAHPYTPQDYELTPPATKNLHAESDDELGVPYDSIHLSVSYACLTGQYPIASAGGPGDLNLLHMVGVHAPLTVKVVSWTVMRERKYPKMPHPDALDANNKLVAWSVDGDAPHLTPDRFSHQWGLSGVYYYALSSPMLPGDDVPLCKTQIDSGNADDKVVPGSAFTKDLIAKAINLQIPLQGK